MRKFVISLALIILYAVNVTAQVSQVSGYVYSTEDNEPLVGATVKVDGTSIAGATNVEGKFTLTGLNAKHQSVTISFIGFESKTVNAASNLNIGLTPKSLKMDEVIVVAFGKQKREAFTGSASVLSSADITKQQVDNPVDALNGRVAGLQMNTSNTLSSTKNPSIRIRGFSSLNASNQPLIVVDGIPYSGYMSDINPADIENMTVLKDAASNALYGARGANGVILITTKNADRSKTKVTVDAKWGVNSWGRVDYDIIDNAGEYYEAHYMALKNYYRFRQGMSTAEAHAQANAVMGDEPGAGGLGYMVYAVPQGQYLIGTNGRLNPNAFLGNRVAYNNQIYTLYPDDWLKEGTRNGFRQEYNLSLSGGSDKYSIMATMGYLTNEGICYGSSFDRFSARLKTTYNPYSFMRFGANAGYTHTTSHDVANVFGVRYSTAPIYPLYIRDGNGNILTDKNGKRYDYGNYDMGCIRPVDMNGNIIQDDILNKNADSNNSFSMQGFATIDFLKDFHFTINGGIFVTERRWNEAYNPYYGYSIETGGEVYVDHYRTTDANTQQLLNYTKTIDKHNIDVLLGHEYTRTSTTSLGGSASRLGDYEQNVELSGAILTGTNFSTKGMYNVEGFFGRAQYDYDSRYFLSGSYRRDGSSRFHPDHRWGNFWSVGGAWILSKEEWFPKTPVVNMLKFKASYGQQGNDGIGAFRYTDLYNISNANDEVAYIFSAKGNPDITWETVGSFNTGFEFELFNSRLTGDIEFYRRKTTDMLMWLTSPYEIGYSGYYENVGDMTNTGIELDMNADLIATRNFKWSFGFNAAWQVNRIVYIPDAKAGRVMEGHQGYIDGNFYYGEGLPMYTFYTKRYAGVNEDGLALYYYADKNGETKTTTVYDNADYYLCGNAMPKLFGGFNTTFTFRGIDVSALFNYSIGGKKWDNAYKALMTAPTGSTVGYGLHRDVFQSWSPENPTSDIPMFYYMDTNSNPTSDRFLCNASYLTFRNLSIGYTFPKAITSKLKLSSLRVYGVCENVAYWTKRKGFDPRSSLTAGSNGNYAPMRTISGGIQVQF